MNIGVNLRIITYRIHLEQNMKPALEENCYSGNADFFVQNGVFVPFSNRIVLCRFKRRLKEKTAFFLSANHKALIKTPFIVSNGPVYRLFYWPINNRFKQNVFNG